MDVALLKRPADPQPRVPACLRLQLMEMHVSDSPAAQPPSPLFQFPWKQIAGKLGTVLSLLCSRDLRPLCYHGNWEGNDGSGAARLLSSLSGTPVLTHNPLLPSVPLSSGCKPLSVAGTRPGDGVYGRGKAGLLEHP